jgi:Sec-independent protein translocase protein TatA
MKLSELARAIGKSEKTLKKNFNRTKQTLEK